MAWSWVRWGLRKGSPPEGSGHSHELPELKKHWDTALKYRVWAVLCGAVGWTQSSLWVIPNSGHPVILRGCGDLVCCNREELVKQKFFYL